MTTNLSRRALARAVLGILLTTLAATAVHGEDELVPIAVGAGAVDLSLDESEIVAVASTAAGLRAWVVGPGAACDGSGDASRLAVIEWAGASKAMRESVIDLGLGEATSVAAFPDGGGAIVVRKDPVRPNVAPGSALLVAGGRIAGTHRVGPGPDSVAISPDGRFAIVACEASAPDEDDCPSEDPDDDLPGSIWVLALDTGVPSMRTAAIIEGGRIFATRLAQAPQRARDARQVEPEYVAIAPDASLALVTLQEQSAVAVIDLRAAGAAFAQGLDPAVAGARALADVVLLPHDVVAPRRVHGSHPDGIAIAPDGTFAVTANEAHPRSSHLQGVSILDLRGGSARVRVASTLSLFDLDPTLGRAAAGERRAKRPERRLPRLDPEGVAVFERGGRTLAALAIERAAAGEASGSVLFLDVSAALDGRAPSRLARLEVGANRGARPEGIVATADGGTVLVACERDGGTLSRIEIRAALAPTAATGTAESARGAGAR